jgi:hypothetical protein
MYHIFLNIIINFYVHFLNVLLKIIHRYNKKLQGCIYKIYICIHMHVPLYICMYINIIYFKRILKYIIVK